MIHSTPEESELWIRIYWIWIRIRIRIQHFKWIRIQGFDDQNLKVKIQLKNCLIFFLIKNFCLLMSKLQEKPSALKRDHPPLKKIKFVNFFLCLWVIFALLDPDPQHWEEWIGLFGSWTWYIVFRLGSDHFCAEMWASILPAGGSRMFAPSLPVRLCPGPDTKTKVACCKFKRKWNLRRKYKTALLLG